jgi:hypothetical protein
MRERKQAAPFRQTLKKFGYRRLPLTEKNAERY